MMLTDVTYTKLIVALAGELVSVPTTRFTILHGRSAFLATRAKRPAGSRGPKMARIRKSPNDPSKRVGFGMEDSGHKND